MSLTKKDNVEDSIGYLVKKNKRINIIVTDGKNAVNSYLNKKKYKSYPPHTKIKNENGAGDVLNAIFNYFFFNSFNELDSLNLGICAGSLQAAEYKENKEKYLQKLDKLSRSIKYKKQL